MVWLKFTQIKKRKDRVFSCFFQLTAGKLPAQNSAIASFPNSLPAFPEIDIQTRPSGVVQVSRTARLDWQGIASAPE
jgi:hypothetical protein